MNAADLIVKIEILDAYIQSLLSTKPINLQKIEQGFSQRKELLDARENIVDSHRCEY